MVTDKWLDNSMFHYKVIQLGNIKPRNVWGLDGDQQQNTMDHYLVNKKKEASKELKQMRSIERELKLARID